MPKDTWAKAVITDSNFFFSAAVTGAAEAVVDFQVGVGGNILNSNFHIVEVNGTAVYQGPPSVDGFRVLGAGAFDWNYVTSHHVHAITGKLFNGAIKNNTIRVQGPQ